MNVPDQIHPAQVESDHPIEAAIGPDSVELGPWQSRLILFQRIAGGFMLIKGLYHWSVLFSGANFVSLSIEGRSATVFFAVIDLIAGVALWLGSGWGSAVWLIAVMSQIIADVVFLSLTNALILLTTAELVLVVLFAVVRFKAYAEERQ